MKIRTVILIVGVLLVASFSALNLNEILRPTSINLGVAAVEAPLGLVLLGLMVAMLCFFLIAMVLLQTGHLMELRHTTKELKEQRVLADQAEQSRFTELSHLLKSQASTQQAQQASADQTLFAHMAELEQKLLTRLDESHNGLAAAIGEMEDRIERQVKSLGQVPR
jgi:uncharacterized integral membrane protein